MNMKNGMPFEAGQIVEAKSFIKGYRGAWFRCKIQKTRNRRSLLECFLEYCDFPDEKIKWTKLYQAPPKDAVASSDLKQRKKELMLRPSFPPFYKEIEQTPQHTSGEVRVVVNDTWRIGDLVDLWCDGCFWSGKIIKLYAVDSVEVELPGPPVGEGGIYKGVLKDLRPSLDWSLEKGWSVPISQANGDSWCTAHLVGQSLGISSFESDLRSAAGEASDPSCSLREVEKKVPGTSNSSSENPSGEQNPRADPDVIGESIMELEEVATKIRWLQGLLQYGFTWSNNMRPSWKFLPDSN